MLILYAYFFLQVDKYVISLCTLHYFDFGVSQTKLKILQRSKAAETTCVTLSRNYIKQKVINVNEAENVVRSLRNISLSFEAANG